MKCNIIGAGRLGKNIALALSATQMISTFSVCNRSLESSRKACQDIGSGHAFKQIEMLPEADITWICSNDDAIAPIVEILLHQSALKPGDFIIHSSGVLNSEILAPLQAKGCLIASFHPLKAFKTNYLDSKAFQKVDCVMEGDAEVCAWLKHSFSNLGACITTIKPENKATYHAAACIAANYLITLAACSEELFLKAGLQPEQSRRMLLNLMQGNVTNLQHTENIAESLTGPLMRGDIKTLKLHLDAIENPEVRCLYKAGALASLSLTQFTTEQKKEISQVLESV